MSQAVPTERWEWGLLLAPLALWALGTLGDQADVFVRFHDPWYAERKLVSVERVGDTVRLDNASPLPVEWSVSPFTAADLSRLGALGYIDPPRPGRGRRVAPGSHDDVPAHFDDTAQPVRSATWGLVVEQDGQLQFGGRQHLVALDPVGESDP